MVKKSVKIFLVIFLVCILMFALSIATKNIANTTLAEDNTTNIVIDENTITISKTDFFVRSVAVRLEGTEEDSTQNGVRFKSVITQDKYNEIEANKGTHTVEYGLILIPAYKLTGELTIDTVDVTQQSMNNILGDKVYDEIAYKESCIYVYDIPDEHKTDDIIVRGYIKVDEEIKYYTATEQVSIAEVCYREMTFINVGSSPWITEEKTVEYLKNYITQNYLTYTATYYDGETELGTTNVIYKTSIGQITEPTKKGHTFTKYYLDSGKTTEFSTTLLTGNINLYADFSVNKYNITLNVNEGTINSGNVTEYTYGECVNLPAPVNMSKTGYSFGGWYDNSACTGTAITAISSSDTENKVFYAKWNNILEILNILSSDGTEFISQSTDIPAYVYKETSGTQSNNFMRITGNKSNITWGSFALKTDAISIGGKYRIEFDVRIPDDYNSSNFSISTYGSDSTDTSALASNKEALTSLMTGEADQWGFKHIVIEHTITKDGANRIKFLLNCENYDGYIDIDNISVYKYGDVYGTENFAGANCDLNDFFAESIALDSNWNNKFTYHSSYPNTASLVRMSNTTAGARLVCNTDGNSALTKDSVTSYSIGDYTARITLIADEGFVKSNIYFHINSAGGLLKTGIQLSGDITADGKTESVLTGTYSFTEAYTGWTHFLMVCKGTAGKGITITKIEILDSSNTNIDTLGDLSDISKFNWDLSKSLVSGGWSENYYVSDGNFATTTIVKDSTDAVIKLSAKTSSTTTDLFTAITKAIDGANMVAGNTYELRMSVKGGSAFTTNNFGFGIYINGTRQEVKLDYSTISQTESIVKGKITIPDTATLIGNLDIWLSNKKVTDTNNYLLIDDIQLLLVEQDYAEDLIKGTDAISIGSLEHLTYVASGKSLTVYSDKIESVYDVAMLTGASGKTNTLSGLKIGGTDLGIPYYDQTNDRMMLLFGDTFSSVNKTSGDWRSNVVGITTDLEARDGITFDSFLTDSNGVAKQIISSAHNTSKTGDYTSIPTGGIEVNGTHYVFYMAIRDWENGWTVNFCNVAKSTDGQNFTKLTNLYWVNSSENNANAMTNLTTILGVSEADATSHIAPNFMQIFPYKAGDYIYLFGLTSARYGALTLGRVKALEIEDFSKYEYYCNGTWVSGTNGMQNASYIVGTPSTDPVGEVCVSYNKYLNKYIMTYYTKNKIIYRTSSDLINWSEKETIITNVEFLQLYGGFTHEKFTSDDGKTIYIFLSKWTYTAETATARGYTDDEGYNVRVISFTLK